MSYRARLTLMVGLVVLLVGLMIGTAMYLAVSSSLYATLDRELQRAAQPFSASSPFDADQGFYGGIPSPFEYDQQLPYRDPRSASPDQTQDEDRDRFELPAPSRGENRGSISVVSASGAYQVYGENAGLPPTRMAQNIALRGGQAWKTMTIDGIAYRIYAQQIGPAQAVQVGRTVEGVAMTLRALRAALLFIVFGGLATALIATFLGSQALLRPLRTLQRTMQSIQTTHDLGKRIETHGKDELAQLGTTFNAMLDDLQGSAERERHFLHNASHELRTPLTLIRANAEMLETGLPDDDAAQVITEIREEAERMTRLANVLLQLARAEATEPTEPVDVHRLVDHVVQRLQKTCNTEFRTEHIGSLDARVMAHAYLIEQAIENLLVNASQWTENNQVDIVVSERSVTVRDYGPGIPDDELQLIFDRFHRSQTASHTGTGLGLALVAQAAKLSGASVGAVNRDRGAEFYLEWSEYHLQNNDEQ